jgi:catechol 2,3-dioxygenase-like lactoylglutathione lyase family enzyme
MAKKVRKPATRAATKRTARKPVPTRQKRAAAKKPRAARPTTAAANRAAADVPSLFRINVEVGNLDEAATFYSRLLGLDARKQAGSRCYFTCGPVTLQVVDVSSTGVPHPAAKALYFVVKNLDAIHARAATLNCLSRDQVHGVNAGAISVRPWGERSFYAEDKWANPLCFVEEGTIYPG